MSTDTKGQVARYAATGILLVIIMGVFGGTLGYFGVSLRVIDRVTDALLPFVVVVRFLVHKYWVFTDTKPEWLHQPAKYFVAVFLTWVGYVGLKNGLVHLGAPYWSALGFAGGIAIAARFWFVRRSFNP